jgi:hypothetical protein
MRPLPLFTLATVVATSIASASECHAEPAPKPAQPYVLEMGPSFALVVPTMGSANKTGVSYDSALESGFTLRGSMFRWMRIGALFREGLHGVQLPAAPLGTSGSTSSVDGVRFTTLHLLLEPTLDLRDWLHLHALIGLGWTHADVSAIHLDPPTGPSLRPRGGVFADVPVGVSATADVLWRWATVGADLWYAPAFGQQGDLFEADRYVDRHGSLATVGAMPKPKGALTLALTLSLAL